MTYPVHLKQETSLVGNIPTTVSVHTFSDKILITITQEGRLAQWIQVPMDSTTASHRDTYLPSSNDADDNLLPLPHLTARTLLGGSTEERETTGQLYAVQIASAIAAKDPTETRSVLLGLGLKNAVQPSREQFFDLLELVVKCL